MSIESAPTDIGSVSYLQTEIEAAEQRIQRELERIATLAEFRELWLDVKVQTERRLNGRETVKSIEARIRAVI